MGDPGLAAALHDVSLVAQGLEHQPGDLAPVGDLALDHHEPARLEALHQAVQAMSAAARFSYFFAVASSLPRYMTMRSRACSASSVRPVNWSSFQWPNKIVRSTSSWWMRMS